MDVPSERLIGRFPWYAYTIAREVLNRFETGEVLSKKYGAAESGSTSCQKTHGEFERAEALSSSLSFFARVFQLFWE